MDDSRYTIDSDAGVPLPPALDLDQLEQLAARVMAGEDVAEASSLALRFCDDEEIQQLNRDFLGNDKATDVLSFPGDPDDFPGMPDVAPHLGDLAISIPTAQRQAKSIGHSIAAEIDHLMVHGILHLCGYDHEVSGEEEQRMRQREEHYLGDLSHLHTHHES